MCSITVFRTVSRQFVRFGFAEFHGFGVFVLLRVRMLAVRISCLELGGECPVVMQPKNQESGTGKKPKTRIGNPLIKENKFCKYNVCGKLLCKLLPLKIRERQVRVLKQKFPVC